GHGQDLAPFDAMGDYFSYQSIVDILDPDGHYNTFPFYEAQNQRLGTKPLFQEYRSIDRPTLVIYGAVDEYCRPNVPTVIQLLKHHCPKPDQFTFQTIPGANHSCYRHEPELAEAVAAWVNNQEEWHAK